jgi:hypothetical protein
LKTGLSVCGNLFSSFLGEIAFGPGPAKAAKLQERYSLAKEVASSEPTAIPGNTHQICSVGGL